MDKVISRETMDVDVIVAGERKYIAIDNLIELLLNEAQTLRENKKQVEVRSYMVELATCLSTIRKEKK